MTMMLEPVFEDFAARATGIDLRASLDDEDIAGLHQAMSRYAVLIFPGQPLTGDEQIAFTRRLGPLDSGFSRMGAAAPSRLGNPSLADISNIGLSGEVAERTDRSIVSNMANQLWHSDASFQDPPARYSLLSAVVIPDEGGETEFADMRAAHDRLDPALRRQLDGLVGEHYILHSRLGLGDDSWTEEQKAMFTPVRWPIVRIHPDSGRKLLFIGAHVTRILGMTVPEGRMLLADLLEAATDRDHVYRHIWYPGDAVMWDNRAVLHRGRRFDVTRRRELRRTTTVDMAPGQAAPAAA